MIITSVVIGNEQYSCTEQHKKLFRKLGQDAFNGKVHKVKCIMFPAVIAHRIYTNPGITAPRLCCWDVEDLSDRNHIKDWTAQVLIPSKLHVMHVIGSWECVFDQSIPSVTNAFPPRYGYRLHCSHVRGHRCIVGQHATNIVTCHTYIPGATRIQGISMNMT